MLGHAKKRLSTNAVSTSFYLCAMAYHIALSVEYLIREIYFTVLNVALEYF